MTTGERMIGERNANEVILLREFIERLAEMDCGAITCGASNVALNGCTCYSCGAREVMETAEVMREVYDHGPHES